jgi:hypothetical protein
VKLLGLLISVKHDAAKSGSSVKLLDESLAKLSENTKETLKKYYSPGTEK